MSDPTEKRSDRGMPSGAKSPPPIARVLDSFQRFFSTEASGGLVLLGCTCIALLWANSGWASTYQQLWSAPVTIGTPGLHLTLSSRHWVNDGLMALFFFLVGLEIRREVQVGELASRRAAALPLAAALGGMLVPAVLFTAVNAGGPGAPGWGIPMATDIAFALGILALLGTRAPSGLRVFLAALAIADDLGAVLVIALFYTSTLRWAALGGAAVVLAVLILLNRAGIRHPLAYMVLGVVLWLFVHASGVHATVAGVLLALTIPSRARAEESQTPLQQMERALQGVVAFVIVPLFALANAGVPLGTGVASALRNPVALGVALGLLLGKPLGITVASYAAVRTGIAHLPAGVSWRHVHGASWLGGIGFTMSLFIAGLAFADPVLLDIAKLGVLGGSLCAGLVGYWLLSRAGRSRPTNHTATRSLVAKYSK